jgi:hypothetical protein
MNIDDILKKNKLSFISGPVGLTSFELQTPNIKNKKFYFFGDEHFSFEGNCNEIPNVICLNDENQKQSQKVCYDFPYLLQKIFTEEEKKKKYVDFYLELQYLTYFNKERKMDKKIDINDNLPKISNHFHDCFQKNKDKCKYKTTRFHYTDFRFDPYLTQSVLLSSIIYLPMQVIPTINSHMNDYLENQITKQDIERMLKFYDIVIYRMLGKYLNHKIFNSYFRKDLDKEYNKILKMLIKDLNPRYYRKEIKQLKDFFDNSLKYRKIRNKSIYHIVGSQFYALEKDNLVYNGQPIQKLIKNFIQKQYQKDFNPSFLRKEWNKLMKQYKYFLKTNDQSKFTSDINMSSLLSSGADIMDAYVLARMFREYSTTKRKKHIPSEMVITFSGYHHSQNYIEFFQNVLGLTPKIKMDYNPNEKTKRCLYNSKFQDEFQI